MKLFEGKFCNDVFSEREKWNRCLKNNIFMSTK